MRTLLLLFFLTTLFSCSHIKTENVNIQKPDSISNTSSSALSAIDAKFPLRLNEINFEDKKNIIQLNKGIVSEIEKTIKQYANDIEFDDSSKTYKDTYINTICLHDNAQTIYLVLLQHFPTGLINSKALFYDNQKKKFADNSFDFNLNGLYKFVNGKLKSTTLKTDLKIVSPEIELVDNNKDGTKGFKFTGLFHDGTFNSIHTTILTVRDLKIDLLNFSEKELGE